MRPTLRRGSLLAIGIAAAACASTNSTASKQDGGGCPPTPAHCTPGYRFDSQTCGCDPVLCTVDTDCANLGQVVCDTGKGQCAASSTVDKCAAVFTCPRAVKPGGTCDCHLDCQCDPGNASGLGATSCVGAGGLCMPRCTDQKDPALFCDCYQHGTSCTPTGACATPCKGQTDCAGVYKATCTGGFCLSALDPSINQSPCVDAGPIDAAGGG